MTLFRNSLLSLMPMLVAIAVSILTVPLYISLVGAERYGALLVAFVLLGYFGQADFGLGRAVTQRLSSSRNAALGDHSKLIWSALLGAIAISLIGAVLVYIAGNVIFGSFFDADASLKAEALDAAWLFALCVPIIMLTGVSSGALTGLERFGTVSLGTTLGNILSQTLPLLVAAFHSVELSWLIGASLVGRTLGLLPVIAKMWSVFLRGHEPSPSWQQLRGLFSFGSWIMVTALIGPLMLTSDRVVIGSILGAAAVTAYSVPFLIAQRTATMPMAVMQALFPRIASQTKEGASELGKDTVVLVGQAYAFVVIGLICLAEPLLRLWLGDNLDPRSIMVGRIAMVGFWINALAGVPYAHIQARGNSRFTAVAHLLELPVYFAMLFILGMWLGLAGVALAFAARTLIDCVIMFVKAEFHDARVLWKLACVGLLILAAMAASPLLVDWLYGLIAASMFTILLLPLVWSQMPGNAKSALLSRQNP